MKIDEVRHHRLSDSGDTVSVVQWPDTFRWKDPDSATAAAPPAQAARAVQKVDDVTAQEVEVSGVRRGVVTEGMSQTRLLPKDRGKTMTSDQQVWVSHKYRLFVKRSDAS